MSDYTAGLEEQLEQMRQKLAALEVERDELLLLKPYWGVPYFLTMDNDDGSRYIRWGCDYGTRQYRIGYVFCDADNLNECTQWHTHLHTIKLRLKSDTSGYGGHITMEDAQAVLVGTYKASIKENANG